jgi:hypothetical protein
MVNQAFTSYGFKAGIGTYVPPNDTRINRTMPNRIGIDVVNVKDWGAVGNGIHDDAPAIQAAIQWAYNSCPAGRYNQGARVFIPPGTYLCNSSITLANIYNSANSSLQIYGAGRDATVLKGSIAGGAIVSGTAFYFLPLTMRDMTIWNTSTATGSSATRIKWLSQQSAFENMRFKGVSGMLFGSECYNMLVSNCIAECIVAGRPAGSWGIECLCGQYRCCSVSGFDRGFEVSGGSISVLACKATDCNIGIFFGGTVGVGTASNGNSLLGNVLTNCTWGINVPTCAGTLIAANVIDASTYGITTESSWNTTYAANILGTRGVGFDNTGHGMFAAEFGLNTCVSMRGPNGFTLRVGGSDASARNGIQWDFVNCGVAGANPPVMFLSCGNLPFFRQQGAEFNVYDGSAQGRFGGVVTGPSGDGGRYKVRYDGTNWIRVG